MSTKKLYLKLDGNTTEYRNHQIDAKQLANALSNFSDLIIESDRRINGESSSVEVKANAKFIEGSFGIEIIVEHIYANKDVLAFLGFSAAGAATNTLVHLIKDLAGRKIAEDIIIDEHTGQAKIVLKDGQEIDTSKEVADLLESPSIRKRIDELINGSVGKNGTTSFVVAEDESFQNKLFEVEPTDAPFYKSNANSTRKPFEILKTEAIIQFTRASRNSGTSGWKMIHLGQEVAVSINDEEFLNSIISDDSPSIFADRFKVELITKLRNGLSDSEKKFVISKVISRNS